MKRFINIFFIFVALFCVLGSNIDGLSAKISDSQILNHFISQNIKSDSAINLKINNDRKYLVKSNSISESVYLSRKPNQLTFISSDDFVLKNSLVLRIYNSLYKKVLFTCNSISIFYLKNDICVRAP